MTIRIETTAKITASFGAALAGLGVAAPAGAVVTDLQLTQLSTGPEEAGFLLSTTVLATGSRLLNEVMLRNNALVQKISFNSSGSSFSVTGGVGMLGKQLSAGLTLAPGFSGQSASASVPPGFAAPGSFYVAFQTQGYNGRGDGTRVGWMKLMFASQGGGGSDVSILGGSVAGPGESIRVGESASASAVPLPATLPLAGLGVLALGAAGLRRKRKAAAAA